MMKKFYLGFLLLLCYTFKVLACGNYYYSIDKEGRLVAIGYDWRTPFYKNFNLELNVGKLKKLEKKLKADKYFMLLSDYSVGLMKLGKSKEALIILAELYDHYPDEYILASNLGTAFELNGQVDSALKYIRRGLELNPNDHAGSEWIHVKILEAKQQLRKDPAWLDQHSILGLSEKQKNDTLVFNQLNIQLQERIPFTPGPDAIVANLLVDLGDISANVRSVEYARAYYMIAKEYYGSKDPALDVKIKEMMKLMGKYSAIRAPDTMRYKEGQPHRMSSFKYTEILEDNAYRNFKIDWSKINTDPTSLLALVNFAYTAEAAKTSELTAGTYTVDVGFIDLNKNLDTLPYSNSVSPLPTYKAPPEIVVKQPAEGKDLTWLYGLIATIVAGGGFHFFLTRSRKKD